MVVVVFVVTVRPTTNYANWWMSSRVLLTLPPMTSTLATLAPSLAVGGVISGGWCVAVVVVVAVVIGGAGGFVVGGGGQNKHQA